MPCILMVEDSPTQVRAITNYFALTNYQLEVTERLQDAVDRVQRSGIDAILLDLSLGDSHGPETFYRMHAAAPRLPIVILTSTDDEDLALQLLRAGAEDYLVKGEVTAGWVRRALRYAIERRAAAIARQQPASAVAPPPPVALALQLEQRGTVTIVRVQEQRLVESELIERLSARLFELANQSSSKKFVLDCARLDYLSNSALAQLLMWDQKIRKNGGNMRICNLRPEVQDQIKVRKMLAQFDICIDETTALQGL